MKKFLLSSMFAAVAMLSSAATASYSDGKLTLDFIGDWAVVENGNGAISIVNGEGLQLATTIGEPDYDFTNTGDYQVLVYNVAGRIDAGDYTVKIADGAIVGHKTDPWSFDFTSVGALELPLTVTGEGGTSGDAEVARLGAPTIELLAGDGINIKYTYPNSFEPENYNKAAVEQNVTLLEDGQAVAEGRFMFLYEPTFFYGVHFQYEEVAGKEYKVVFPAGCWTIELIDPQTYNSTVVVNSEEQTFTWKGGESQGTIGGDDQPGDDQPGDDQPQQPAGVDGISLQFLMNSSLSALENDMEVAKVTVDRAFYQIYWTVTSEQDPEFVHVGGFGGATKAGTYVIKASTPSAEPMTMHAGCTYKFTFQSCEFGWDPYQTIAEYYVEGTGGAVQQYSDITITSHTLGTPGALGYAFKNQVSVTFSAPVKNVHAYAPQGLMGTDDFNVTAADQTGLNWNIDLSPAASVEGGFELHITAVDATSNLPLRGTYGVDHSFIYTIFVSTSNPDDEPGLIDPVLPSEELEIASLTINGKEIKLSETQAVELESYPEGAVFTITLADEAIKKISYEIIDHTADEIYKSISDLTKGENGQWTATMPKDYALAAGHVYYIHVIARNGMSSFTSQVLYEYNFLVNGTANVAQYSTVTVARISPNESEVITEAEPTIVITFSEAIASVTAKAITGQMMSMKIPAQNITTSDNISWSIQIPAGAINQGNLQLDIVAIDNQGNRVNDATHGVGTPETCYLSYDWFSTIGLPTPKMAENGKTVEAISSLTFTYDGIGLNQDNATATWGQITIALNGVDLNLAITADMFSVSGDASVGGTKLTLTLPEALTENGVYTITVPALAFMLGHDNSNFYCGDCQFTVTVKNNTTGIDAVVAGRDAVRYNLNGQKLQNRQGGIFIENGHKVIIK